MKNLKFNSLYRILFVLPLLALLFSACSDEDSKPSGSNDLTLESVSLFGYVNNENVYTPIDSVTTVGFSGNQYVIRGTGLLNTKEIFFNDFKVYFNPTMVTDTNIVFQMPVGVPYSNDQTSNQLKVVTTKGAVAYLDFNIGQPLANLVKYPLGGPAGTVATITGTDFDNVSAVKFGTIPAEIVSSTPTSIVVVIPEGIVGACKIFVTTSGGTAESAMHYGFNYMIYDDSKNNDWWEGSWGGVTDLAETTFVRDGAFSVKKTYSAWGGFQIGNGGAAIDMSNYTILKVSLYATNPGKVNMVISGNAKEIILVPGVWTDYEFSLSQDFNGPASPGIFLIQEFSGQDQTLYVDNLGFI